MKTLLATIVLCLLSFFSIAQNDSVINLHEVKIFSSKLSTYNSGLKQYSFDSTLLKTYQQLSLSDLLNENSAIFLKNYGSGELATISLRGGSVYHTAVLWNGFSISNPMLGLADLSCGKNFFFDDVNIQYGGTSSLWGSGAVSGSIHLNNIPSFNSGLKIACGIQSGSFNKLVENFSINFGTKNYSTTLKFYNERNENNFQFYNGNTKLREEQIYSHINQNAEVPVSTGQVVLCSADGTFCVTPGEWQEVKVTHGVTLVYHLDQTAG